MTRFSHLKRGQARMVDVGGKSGTLREAVAFTEVALPAAVLALLLKRGTAKGDALGVARVAAIMAAKRVDELIPLCHTVPLDSISVSFLFQKEGLLIRSVARASGKTGVEMEALTAAGVAALTIYDMVKSVGPGVTIGPLYLGRKTGGKLNYVKSGLPKEWLLEEGGSLPWA